MLPLTSCTAPAPTAVAVTGTNVQPLLLSLAEEEPDLAPRMIVQFSGDAEELAAQVEALGGSAINYLEIIGALVIEMPVSQVATLAAADGVRWISLDAPCLTPAKMTANRF
ncbi:MAG: hypothetical protein R2873_10720 [Caldilineaceae bacterium]